MISSFKFIQKFWTLHKTILDFKDNKNRNNQEDNNLEIFTNQMIDKITKNLESFHYNVIIANLHEIYNYLSKNIINLSDKKKLIINYEKILKIISPIMPHFTNECLDDFNAKQRGEWPLVKDRKSVV